MMQEYSESIEDCRRVLEIEPFHFGALSGMGLCFLNTGDLPSALDAFERTLQVSCAMPMPLPQQNLQTPVISLLSSDWQPQSLPVDFLDSPFPSPSRGIQGGRVSLAVTATVRRQFSGDTKSVQKGAA